MDGGIKDICRAMLFHTIYWNNRQKEIAFCRMVLEGLTDDGQKAVDAYNDIIRMVYGGEKKGRMPREEMERIMEEESKKAIFVRPAFSGLDMRNRRGKK